MGSGSGSAGPSSPSQPPGSHTASGADSPCAGVGGRAARNPHRGCTTRAAQPQPPPASAPTQTPFPALSHPLLCCARSSECTAEQGQAAPACGRWVLQGLWGRAGARGRFLALTHQVRFPRYCHDSAQHLQHSCHQCFKCLHHPPTVTQQEEVSGFVLQMHGESRHPARTLPGRVEASSPRAPTRTAHGGDLPAAPSHPVPPVWWLGSCCAQNLCSPPPREG